MMLHGFAGGHAKLGDPNCLHCLDIGGELRSHMISSRGNNSRNTAHCILETPSSLVESREAIEETMRRTVGAAAIKHINIVANPNLGYETDAAAIIEGVEKVKELFPEKEILFLCVDESLVSELEGKDLPDIFPVSINNLPVWLQ